MTGYDRTAQGHTIRDYAGFGLMFLRGVIYFLLRLKLPRMVFMARGARIYGLGNIEFRGRTKLGLHSTIDARNCSRLVIGQDVSLGDFSILRCSGSPHFSCPGVSLGDRVTFGPYCNVGGGFGLTIGSDCIFGPYVSIHPEYHLTASRDVPIRDQGIDGKGIVIGADNWAGAKATILDGAELGRGNIIAAAAVLAKGSYGDNTIYGGIPAREIGRRE